MLLWLCGRRVFFNNTLPTDTPAENPGDGKEDELCRGNYSAEPRAASEVVRSVADWHHSLQRAALVLAAILLHRRSDLVLEHNDGAILWRLRIDDVLDAEHALLHGFVKRGSLALEARVHENQ